MISSVSVYFIALFVGFNVQEAHKISCIAKYESAYNPDAINVNNPNSRDRGLLQINTIWDSKCKGLDLWDPVDNVRCGKIVYDNQGFDAWVAYKKHKKICDDFRVPKCPIVDTINDLWYDIDPKAFETGKRGCETKYFKCFKKFIVKGPFNYHVICGV